MKLVLLLMLLFIVPDEGYYIEHRKTFLAQDGTHVRVEVDHYPAKVRIEYRPSPDDGIKRFFEDRVREGYKYSYKGNVGVFEILNITKENAGYYEFFYALYEGGGIEYAINIILADLQCGLNYPVNYIGDNDCHLEKDKVDAWCELKIPKKPDIYVPIKWRIGSKDKGDMNVAHANDTYISARELDVALEVDEVYECHASTLRCATKFHPEKLFYAMNTTSRALTSYHFRPMTPNNIQAVVCKADVSASVQCTYSWEHKDGDFVSKFSGNILQEKDFIKDGVYECFSSCEDMENPARKCVLLADRVEFSSQNKGSNGVSILPIKTFLAREGENVKMEVEHFKGKLQIKHHLSPHKLISTYYEDALRHGYKHTFNASVGTFEIESITKDKAGYYDFSYVYNEGGGVEYSIHIIIAELQCGLNYPVNYIGENDCHLEKDKVDAWCRVELQQRTKAYVPIKWRIGSKDKGDMNVAHANDTYISARELDVALEVDEVYECHASTLRCATKFHPEKLFYAKNTTSRVLTSYHLRPMTSNKIQAVVCKADVSASVQCTYSWEHKDGDFISKFPGNILKEEDLIKDGVYKCLAVCDDKKHLTHGCVLLADRVEFSSQSKKSKPGFISTSTTITIVVVLLVLIVVSILSKVFVYRGRKKIRRKFLEAQLEEFNERPSWKEIDDLESKLKLIETILLAYEDNVTSGLNIKQIGAFKMELSKFRNDLAKVPGCQKHLDELSKFETYLAELGNTCKEHPTYKDDLPRTVYEELQRKKEDFEQALKGLKEYLKLKISKLEKKTFKKTDESTTPNEGIIILPLALKHQQTIDHLRKLLPKLSDLQDYLQSFQSCLKSPSSVYIILDKCLKSDEEILNFLKRTEEKSDLYFIECLLYEIGNTILDEILKSYEADRNLKRLGVKDEKNELFSKRQQQKEEREKLRNLEENLHDLRLFIDKIKCASLPHDYTIVDHQAVSDFYEKFSQIKTEIEVYEKYCDIFSNFKELQANLSDLIEDLCNYETALEHKKENIGLKSFDSKLRKKKEQIMKVLKAFQEDLQIKLSTLKETNTANNNSSGEPAKSELQSQTDDQTTNHLKKLSELISNFNTVLDEFEKVFEGPLLLCIDLDKCLKGWDEKLLGYWNYLKSESPITRETLENLHLRIKVKTNRMKYEKKEEWHTFNELELRKVGLL